MSPFNRHKEKWNNCERCSLCVDRKRVVHARGKMPCDYLFIGEAPGDSEDVLGKPFVGLAGQLLDALIEKALLKVGIEFPRMGFINTVGCIPKENGNKVGEPRPDQIDACEPRVLELINLFKPSQGIVLVGKVAQSRVISYYPVIPKGVNIFYVVHPAAILKAPLANKALMAQEAESDLIVAFETTTF